MLIPCMLYNFTSTIFRNSTSFSICFMQPYIIGVYWAYIYSVFKHNQENLWTWGRRFSNKPSIELALSSLLPSHRDCLTFLHLASIKPMQQNYHPVCRGVFPLWFAFQNNEKINWKFCLKTTYWEKSDILEKVGKKRKINIFLIFFIFYVKLRL